jgi:hypothetical protein
VVTGAADDAVAVEGRNRRAGRDPGPIAVQPCGQVRSADRTKCAAAQVQFGLDVAGAERAELDVAQRLTRAFP